MPARGQHEYNDTNQVSSVCGLGVCVHIMGLHQLRESILEEGMSTAGQPTKYKVEYAEIAYKLCLLGLTDEELGKHFEVCEATINNWKIEHPEFLESIHKGKDIADAEIAEKLHHRARGYSHPEEKIFCHEGTIIRAETTKHYPPDTGAAFIWLKNRKSDKWRDRKAIDIDASQSLVDVAAVFAAAHGEDEDG